MNPTKPGSKDLEVTINHSCPEDISIEFVQQIEQSVDKALSPLGFERSTTEKSDKVIAVYYHFGFYTDKKGKGK